MSKIIDNSECAFPSPDVYGSDGCGIKQGTPGMSMRQWYAGLAMQALVTRGAREKLADYIESAYTIADFMLLEDAAARAHPEAREEGR